MAMKDQQDIFAKRLKRIHSGEGNTLGRIHCGIQEIPVKNNSIAAKSTRAGASLIWKMIWIPASIALACMIGIVATIAARVGVFQAANAGQLELSAQSSLMADAGLGILLAFVICFMLKARQNYHMVAAAVGACMMLGGMHNLVHEAPDLWSKAFSPEWVQDVVTSTKPDSFEFRGLSLAAAS